ncbi:MAG: hypothetical protein KC543_07935 [Myxococcales bacterium]|nr:hypothetical protein [Myxococcales bacterium]
MAQSAQPDSGPVADAAAPSGSAAAAPTESQQTLNESSPRSEPTARDRQGAAEAYDRGTAAYLRGDYAAAARWFETANRLAPAAAALVQAIKSYQRGGNDLRAASLALQLKAEFPDDQEGQELADDVLASAQPQYARIVTSCDARCAIQVDGGLVGFHDFFVVPGVAHEVVANFKTGAVSQTANVPAGQTQRLDFAAPPPPPEALAAGAHGSAWQRRPKMHPAVFYSLAALTAGSLGATIWSGVDTKSGVSDYEDAAARGDAELARRLLDSGQDKERRTNILIGVTSALAAGTVASGLFTRFKSRESDPEAGGVSAGIAPARGGGMVSIAGRF